MNIFLNRAHRVIVPQGVAKPFDGGHAYSCVVPGAVIKSFNNEDPLWVQRLSRKCLKRRTES